MKNLRGRPGPPFLFDSTKVNWIKIVLDWIKIVLDWTKIVLLLVATYAFRSAAYVALAIVRTIIYVSQCFPPYARLLVATFCLDVVEGIEANRNVLREVAEKMLKRLERE